MLPTLPRLSGAVRRAVRYAAVALLALVIVTCTDNPIGPGHPGLGRLNVVPVYPAYSRVAPLAMDNYRIIVVRPPADTLARVAHTFNADSTQVRTSVSVPLASSSEDLDVTIELYAGSILLFRGTRTITVTQGFSAPADSVPVAYQGPGAQLASLTISPRDTVVPFGAAFSFGASATDSGGNALAQFYVSWSASAGSINGQGLFTAPAARDTLVVSAITPTGIADSTTVIVEAPPATLTKVSGDGQSGIIGTRLAQPLVVRVDGTDGQPVAGVPVTFAVVSGGGSVDSATATTNAQGLAVTGATLGTTVGAQSYSAGAAGLATVTFTATGTGGGVKTWTGSVDGNWGTAANWNPAAVPVAGDSVVIPLVQNQPTFSGTATIGALTLSGNSAFMSVSGALTVSGSVTLPDSNQFVTVSSGSLAASSVTLAGYQAFLDASSGALTVSGPTLLSGDRSFIDATGTAPTLGPVVASGSQAFLSQRGGTTGAIQLTGSTAFWTTEGTITVTGNPALVVSGTGAFASTSSTQPTTLTLAGDVQLGGTGGYFDLGAGGTRVTVNGNLLVTGTAFLRETFATDTMVVTGNASFTGGDEAGKLTAGGLFVGGNFTQGGAVATSFVGSGTHSVFLNGAGPQTLSFSAPGFASSRFQNVIVANSAGGITATSDVYASGTAGVTPTAVRTLNGNGSTLFTTILNVSNFTFNNLLLDFAGSTVVTFDTVSFQGYAPTATPLTISHPGAAAPLTFLNVSFGVTPTSGFYLSATDTNPSDGVPLVIDMVNPSPLNPGSFVQTAGGAVVNWPAGVAPGTWTGTVDTSWNTAANWSDGAVPTATTDVTIPAGTPFAPTTSGTVRPTRNLTVQSGATLTLSGGGLNVSGSLDAAGLITGASAGMALTGSGTVRGNFTGTILILTINGSYTLNGRLVATALTINGSLDLAGHTAVVGGTGTGNNFQTVNAGVLTMQSPLDSLIMTGGNPAVTFTGGSTAGRLTDGVIYMMNTGFSTFTQDNLFSDSSYAPSGAHKVVLATGTTLALNFATPGAGSHFNGLDISAQAAGFSLSTPIRVNGTFTSQPSATAPAINGGNRLLTLAGPVQVTGLTLTNAPTQITGDNPVTFDNVTLQGFITTVTQLQVSGTGAAARTFNNTTFSTTPTGAGLYLAATDADGAGTNGALTVNMVNATPATPGTLTSVTNGAVINWPASGNAHTWTGAADASWENPANWTGGGGPGITGDAIIPPGTPNSPVLGSSHQINALTVQAGASVNLAGFTLTLGGDLSAPAATAGFTGGGSLFLVGTGAVAGGNLGGLTLDVGGGYTLNARTVVGALSVSGSGNLALGGQTIVVNGSVTTSGSGVLTMTNALDSVLAAGAGTFGGGDETGKLTAGYLKLGGSFGQSSATSAASFAASGTHRTEMGAGAIRVINFATPGAGAGTSHFNDLVVSTATGGINLSNNTFVNGQLVSHPTGTTPVLGVVSGAKVLTAAGVDVSRLGIDQNVMTIGAGTITQFDSVAFTGQANGVAQLTVDNPGAATAFTFDRLTFAVTPINGVYLAANDADGAAPNALTINMSNASPGAPSPSLFTATNGAVINWPPAAPVITWTGAISTDWSIAGNWSPAQVPTSANDVVIPSGKPTATVTSSCAAKSLTVNGPMSLGTFDCQVQGNVVSNGVITGTTGRVVLLGPAQINGNFPNLLINAPVTVVGATGLGGGNGNITIDGATASLTMNGQTLVMPGSLAVQNGGTLVMTNPADVLTVSQDVLFDGGDETGLLTAGQLTVVGNFTQAASTSTNSFRTGGNHLTVLTGGPTTTITFASPASSRFQELDVTGRSTGLVLGSSVTIAGQLISVPSGANGPTFSTTAPGSVLTAGGADVSALSGFTALTFDGVPLVLSGGTIGSFGRVTFINQNPNGTALTVNNVGQPTAYTFGDLTFSTALSAGGFHLVANDLDGASPNALVIDVLTSFPATGAGVSQATNGAVINWPPTGAVFTWTGAVSQDWNVAGNWDKNAVPSVIDDVVLVPITNQPKLTTSVGIHNLTSQAGSILDVGDSVLVVGGTVDLAGQVNGNPGTGGVVLNGTGGQLLRGTFNTTLAVNGDYVMNGNTVVNGDLAIAGQLDVGPFNITVSGSLTTLGSGVLVEVDPASFVDVGSDAIFGGGSTAGLLKAGTLRIAGNFFQLATNSAQSFSADPGHLTQLSANPADILFSTPGPTLSHFGDLAESGFGATFTLGSDVTILGYLSGGDGFGGTLQGSSCPTVVTLHDLQGSSPTFDCVQLVLDDPAGTTSGFGGGTFVNLPTSVTQLTIRHPGISTGAYFTNSINFVPLTTGDAGHYIDAQDTDASSPFLVVNAFFTNVTNGPSFTTTSGGASVIWGGAGIKVWTGGASSDWNTTSNWNTFTLPTTTDTVIIGPATFQPQLTPAVAQVAAVRVQFGTLDLFGHHLQVTTDFSTSGSGAVKMTSLGDTLEVGGNVTFDGASTSGLMTGGVLLVGGDFTQGSSNSPTSFAPSGTHYTRLGAAAAHTVSFATPGGGAGGSHFNTLDVTPATGGLTFNSNAVADSAFLISVGAGAPKLFGTGHSLTARQWQVQAGTIDNLSMILDEQGTIFAHAFNGVTFSNFPTSGAQIMTITGVGSNAGGRPSFTPTNVNFPTLSTGLYVKLTSSNAQAFIITMSNSNQRPAVGGNGPALSDPPNQTTVNGAQILWQ